MGNLRQIPGAYCHVATPLSPDASAWTHADGTHLEATSRSWHRLWTSTRTLTTRRKPVQGSGVACGVEAPPVISKASLATSSRAPSCSLRSLDGQSGETRAGPGSPSQQNGRPAVPIRALTPVQLCLSLRSELRARAGEGSWPGLAPSMGGQWKAACSALQVAEKQLASTSQDRSPGQACALSPGPWGQWRG